MKVLAVTAHADDFEVHMSGLAIRLAKAGHEIVSVVTTMRLVPKMEHVPVLGETMDYWDYDKWGLSVRGRESVQAHAIIGVRPSFLDCSEQKLSVSEDQRREWAERYKNIAPDALITHWPIDVNPDHRATAILAMEPALQRGVNTELFFFEPCSAGRNMPTRPQALAFTPTHYVDVSESEVIEQKRNMIECHVSQEPEGLLEGQLNLERNRGIEAGVPRAEAYIRATRWGPIHPELSPFFIPTPFQLPRGIGVDFTPEAIGLTS